MRARLLAFATLVCMLTLMIVASSRPTLAATPHPNVGYSSGVTFGAAADVDATAAKPQSKLWYNDGSWWSVMFDASSADSTYHIFQLDTTTNTWLPTTATVDDRPLSRADALWDGSKLYIVSTLSYLNFPSKSPIVAANEGRLYRFSYSSATKHYTLDTGFPVVVMNGST